MKKLLASTALLAALSATPAFAHAPTKLIFCNYTDPRYLLDEWLWNYARGSIPQHFSVGIPGHQCREVGPVTDAFGSLWYVVVRVAPIGTFGEAWAQSATQMNISTEKHVYVTGNGLGTGIGSSPLTITHGP